MITENVISKGEYFSPEELYLLAESFGGKTLFGLPEKEMLHLVKPNLMEQAYHTLIEKGLLTSEGKLTEDTFDFINVLKGYYESSKYLCLNDLTIAFPEKEIDYCIVLIPVEKNKKYQIYLVDTLILLNQLIQLSPVLRREPLEEEKEFRHKKMRNSERRILEEKEFKHVLRVELFKPDKELTHWILFEDEDKLYGIDMTENKYFRVSQYWIISLLYEELNLLDLEKVKQIQNKEG